MQNFDKNVLSPLFQVWLSRFQNTEKAETFIEKAVPYLESICPEVGSDKWLFGTDDLTLFDIHAAAPLDFIYVHMRAPAFSDCPQFADFATKAPRFCAY